MSSRRYIATRLIGLLLGGVILAGVRPCPADDPPAPGVFPDLVWKVDPRLTGVRKVFASPVDPDVVLATTDQGLRRTRSCGVEWETVPKTSPGVLGTVTDVAFCPARPRFIVLGSLEKGMFVSLDGGGTWRRAGGITEGLSSLSVHAVTFAREDRAWETLLVSHGTDGRGMSKSIDAGRTWRVLAPMRHFGEVLSLGQELAGASSTADEPDNWQLVRSVNYGETWHPVRRDVLPAAGTRSMLKPLRVVWGIRSGPLLVSTDRGASYVAPDTSSSARWTSVFVTPGRTPAEEWFWAYDPFQAGLTVGRDFETTWVPRNRGLYVDRMIRQEAVVAANACATRFFAAVNGRLYVGDHIPPDEGPVIRQAGARPAVLGIPRLTAETDARQAVYESCERLVVDAPVDEEMAKIVEVARQLKDIRAQRRFALRVRVEHPEGPQAVASVTVTPDLFGLGEVALADDGKHDDGKSADGVWGGVFDFAEEKMWDANRLAADPRSPFPGTRYVPVKAVDRAGSRTDWTLPLSMFFEPRPYRLACDLSDQQASRCESFTEGNVTLSVRDDPESGEGKVLEVKGKAGPWRAYRACEGGERDLTGLNFVTFVFRGAPESGDVAFFLVDQLTGETRYGGREAIEPKRFSHEVPLLEEKLVSVMDGKPHRVRIPVSRLVGSSPAEGPQPAGGPAPAQGNLRFQRRHVAGLGLVAVPGSPGGAYTLSEITFSDD